MCHFDCSDRRYEDSIIAKPWLIKENSKVSHFSVWMITWSQKHLSWADVEFRYLLLFKLHAHTFERLSMSLTSYTGEIDRCLKKVAEGVEQFEDIWQKVSKVEYVILVKTPIKGTWYSQDRSMLTNLCWSCSYTMQPTRTRRKSMRLTSRKRLRSSRWECYYTLPIIIHLSL